MVCVFNNRRDAAFTTRPVTGQLHFLEEAGVETVVAGLGGEEVVLGNEFVFPWMILQEAGNLVLIF